MEENNDNTKRKIRIFKSFEEAEEADANEVAALSPIQLFQNVTMLIKRIYAKELETPMNKTIRFK